IARCIPAVCLDGGVLQHVDRHRGSRRRSASWRSGLMRLLTRMGANRGALAGGVVLAIIVVMALFAPLIVPIDPMATVATPLVAPGEQFAFGTDMLGRDVLAGIVHGARVSLLIGLLSTAVAVLIGVTVGAIAGFF